MMCPGYGIKLHLTMRLPWVSSMECGEPLYYHYFQVHFNLEWKYLLEYYLPGNWIHFKIICIQLNRKKSETPQNNVNVNEQGTRFHNLRL